MICISLLLMGGACDDDDAAETQCPPGQPGAGVDAGTQPPGTKDSAKEAASEMIDEGRMTFRFDTFGDEHFWGDELRLHEAIAGDANGGVGPGVSPTMALAVGLKVDVEAVPPDVASGIMSGTVDLEDPANTLALLKV